MQSMNTNNLFTHGHEKWGIACPLLKKVRGQLPSCPRGLWLTGMQTRVMWNYIFSRECTKQWTGLFVPAFFTLAALSVCVPYMVISFPGTFAPHSKLTL